MAKPAADSAPESPATPATPPPDWQSIALRIEGGALATEADLRSQLANANARISELIRVIGALRAGPPKADS
jgi:hypothetical protein